MKEKEALRGQPVGQYYRLLVGYVIHCYTLLYIIQWAHCRQVPPCAETLSTFSFLMLQHKELQS